MRVAPLCPSWSGLTCTRDSAVNQAKSAVLKSTVPVVSSLCRCHCAQWRYRGNSVYSPRVVHALIVAMSDPCVAVVDSRTTWLLPLLQYRRPEFITSHSRCYHRSPYRHGSPGLARRPIKLCRQCCSKPLPNPVSRISHLHCAFQKTGSDPGLGMKLTQTNPTSFIFTGLQAAHFHHLTIRQNTFANFFPRPLLVVHSFHCTSIYNTRLPHSSTASYHNTRNSE